MRLCTLQRHLERLYEVEVEHDVDDFLVTDPDLARHLDNSATSREVPEKLLVCEDGDSLDIALYLDQALVGRLREDDPTERLHDGNLSDYWTALEGVSHFLYVAWSAGYQRGVSPMELEMQAEVDKYVCAAVLLGRQGEGRIPGALHSRLFDDVSFDTALDAEGLSRYQDANYYAGRYCSSLQNSYFRGQQRGGLLNELRRFYRLSRDGKIRHIRTAH